jgi:hypothetical protein
MCVDRRKTRMFKTDIKSGATAVSTDTKSVTGAPTTVPNNVTVVTAAATAPAAEIPDSDGDELADKITKETEAWGRGLVKRAGKMSRAELEQAYVVMGEKYYDLLLKVDIAEARGSEYERRLQTLETACFEGESGEIRVRPDVMLLIGYFQKWYPDWDLSSPVFVRGDGQGRRGSPLMFGPRASSHVKPRSAAEATATTAAAAAAAGAGAAANAKTDAHRASTSPCTPPCTPLKDKDKLKAAKPAAPLAAAANTVACFKEEKALKDEDEAEVQHFKANFTAADRSKMRSHIHSAYTENDHCWQRVFSPQTKRERNEDGVINTILVPTTEKRSVYVCVDCWQRFTHYYDLFWDINEAFLAMGVPKKCPTPATAQKLT